MGSLSDTKVGDSGVKNKTIRQELRDFEKDLEEAMMYLERAQSANAETWCRLDETSERIAFLLDELDDEHV